MIAKITKIENIKFFVGSFFDKSRFLSLIEWQKTAKYIGKGRENNEYENEKNRILQEFQDKRSVLVEKLNVAAEKQGFKVLTRGD